MVMNKLFKSLFDEYYQGLCVFASAYLKDDDLSADVVQEAFVKFWNRRRDFDHIVKIKSFSLYYCQERLFEYCSASESGVGGCFRV